MGTMFSCRTNQPWIFGHDVKPPSSHGAERGMAMSGRGMTGVSDDHSVRSPMAHSTESDRATPVGGTFTLDISPKNT